MYFAMLDALLYQEGSLLPKPQRLEEKTSGSKRLRKVVKIKCRPIDRCIGFTYLIYSWRPEFFPLSDDILAEFIHWNAPLLFLHMCSYLYFYSDFFFLLQTALIKDVCPIHEHASTRSVTVSAHI